PGTESTPGTSPTGPVTTSVPEQSVITITGPGFTTVFTLTPGTNVITTPTGPATNPSDSESKTTPTGAATEPTGPSTKPTGPGGSVVTVTVTESTVETITGPGFSTTV
ncbi:hypothetical protein MG5_02576, partial [Candida albicans P57072]